MSAARPALDERARRFREAYGEHRAAEGRGDDRTDPFALPFIARGPLARQWAVRARTFVHFLRVVLDARAAELAPRPVRVVDLGAGNGWLCYRVRQRGHDAIAVDIRTDDVDGLGAGAVYASRLQPPFPRIAGTFEALPLAEGACDVAVFNASLHYALDLGVALAEAARVVAPGGRVAVLDSPFYDREADGNAMLHEKRATARERFGALAEDLTALPFTEFLTLERLHDASAALGFAWRRHRVRYPLRYEARPLVARLRGRRTPSRFDLWEAAVP